MSRTHFRRSITAAALAVIMVFAFAVSALAPKAAAAGTFTQHSSGGLTYKLYVPSSYSSSKAAPLVVMLHGCTQDADQFAAGTQMNALAEQEGFLVLYPQQSSARNQNKCWNFFETSNQSRGSGEPAIIVGMVDQVKGSYHIDDEQVFVTGLSAGGAMTAILGATYPDVFQAISVGSGLEYKAATSMMGAFTAMSSGGADPVNCGQAAYQAMGSNARVVPTLIFHGSSDATVVPKNAEQLVTQWLTTNDYADNGKKDGSISSSPASTQQGQVSGGRAYTVTTYLDSEGQVCVQKYLVTSMGHAWSGGSTAGSYTDPNGPNQSAITWAFFQAAAGVTDPDPDPTPTPDPDPDPDPVPQYQSVTATATEHYLAGRLDATGYNTLGLKYGFTTPFTLYLVDGSSVWTDVNPDPNPDPDPDPDPDPEPDPTPTPDPDPEPQYETITATATEHYVAGRLNVTQYNAMGVKYGYNTPFPLYRVTGSSTWTDVKPE